MGWKYNSFTEREEWVDTQYVSARKAKKIANDPFKHHPNKDEAALLRKLKSETGLSEEEIRCIKKYRVMLSEAQKSGQKPKYNSLEQKFYQSLIKDACKDTGLVPQHPDTLITLQCLIDQQFQRGWVWLKLWMLNTQPLPAETAVRYYSKSNKRNVIC